MLVYFDPWLAGVVFPSLIVGGLMAIPYFDTNPKGNGYYTFKERSWEIAVFLFRLPNPVGTPRHPGHVFLRGPNWNFFGPYEYWDVHKLEALVNVNLSEYVWVKAFRTGLPSNILLRESFGFIARPRLSSDRAGGPGQDLVQGLLSDTGARPLSRDGFALVVHGSAAHQDDVANGCLTSNTSLRYPSISSIFKYWVIR